MAAESGETTEILIKMRRSNRSPLYSLNSKQYSAVKFTFKPKNIPKPTPIDKIKGKIDSEWNPCNECDI